MFTFESIIYPRTLMLGKYLSNSSTWIFSLTFSRIPPIIFFQKTLKISIFQFCGQDNITGVKSQYPSEFSDHQPFQHRNITHTHTHLLTLPDNLSYTSCHTIPCCHVPLEDYFPCVVRIFSPHTDLVFPSILLITTLFIPRP